MRLHIASDLHVEFMGKQDYADLLSQFSGDADVLVLAGDIVPLKYVDQVRDVLNAFCERYPEVVFVPGNHEYYGTSVSDGHLILGAAQNEIHNLNVLKNSPLTIRGQKFYGGTLWFPQIPPEKVHLQDLMNDFQLIKELEPFYHVQHQEFRRRFVEHVDKDTIVISHHLPSWESVAPKFTGSPLNRFFVGDCEDLIKIFKPRIWIHGHTHDACDYVGQRFPPKTGDQPLLGSTRVICNPFGYVHELKEWPKPLLVEV